MSPAAPPLEDAIGARLMSDLGLTRESALSDDGDSFVTLACRDRDGVHVVLKYVKPDAPHDAYRRLENEAEMLRRLAVRLPLRILRHRTSGAGYLVTDFDHGRLLVPSSIGEPRVCLVVADALASFHLLSTDARSFRIREREPVGVYYLKVLARHVAHLWPAQVRMSTLAQATVIVTAALPAIVRRVAISHGDFMPTNVLYHDADGTVTFTDFEAVAFNHPLFDVLAVFTMDTRDIDEWDWQVSFLRRYLERMAGALGLDPARRDFWTSYRGILVFFLVYRLNEALVVERGGRYFDGLSKPRYLRAKLRDLLAVRRAPAPPSRSVEVTTRTRNVTRMLSRDAFDRHVAHMRGVTTLQ